MAIHSTEMSRHDKSKTDKTHLNAFDIQRIRFNNKKKNNRNVKQTNHISTRFLFANRIIEIIYQI